MKDYGFWKKADAEGLQLVEENSGKGNRGKTDHQNRKHNQEDLQAGRLAMNKWYDEEYEFCVEGTGFLHGDHIERYCRNGEEIAILSLRERPELLESAATWFHQKWGVPREAYHACMTAYLNRQTEYGWYLCLAENLIVGGLGVIENDFHDRKDLSPNVCAVYTEEACRGQGIAGRLLHFVVEDMRTKGITPLYLVTDHTGFYERYGWEFLCTAHEDDSGNETRVYMHR